ncbi:MAG: hypothetical protein WD716_00430 [Fimbriimonadaceae bacterium]
MRGAKAFLISVGVVVVFLGLLVLTAVPAADVMDRKSAEEGVASTSRRDGIVVGGVAALVLGGALVAWGAFLRGR